ncbi:MAG: short-chain dehydrogenase [SAR86 cluster bacterium]|uniref:Short-chain dehydrogenase n=1 Tax=SAR86 cluster bacterium TaxID=2030880 RepID=A0A2A5B7Z1_9GAMM|nr:MAG: short-chain dehydrogenase [SAR86 cluster bacterium]
MSKSQQRVTLITGANKGIGFEISRQLSNAGSLVLLGARNTELGKKAAEKLSLNGSDVTFVHIDLTNTGSIVEAAEIVKQKYGRLDTLINNAGISDPEDGPPGTTNLQSVRRIFDTNLFGTLEVTQAMLPLLQQSESPQIINLSSGLGSITLHNDPEWEYAPYKLFGYSASKAALNMMTVQLAAELKGSNVIVNSIDPGFTATDLNNHRGTQTIDEGAAAAVSQALNPQSNITGGFISSNDSLPW